MPYLVYNRVSDLEIPSYVCRLTLTDEKLLPPVLKLMKCEVSPTHIILSPTNLSPTYFTNINVANDLCSLRNLCNGHPRDAVPLMVVYHVFS